MRLQLPSTLIIPEKALQGILLHLCLLQLLIRVAARAVTRVLELTGGQRMVTGAANTPLQMVTGAASTPLQMVSALSAMRRPQTAICLQRVTVWTVMIVISGLSTGGLEAGLQIPKHARSRLLWVLLPMLQCCAASRRLSRLRAMRQPDSLITAHHIGQ